MPGGLFCAIGNPLNDGTWQYEWVNGRQLARIYSVDTDARFEYNENKLRVQKTVNGVVTKYILNGKHIAHMTRGNDELHFFYDAQNKPAIVVYNGVPYSYVKNLQGDVVALLDSTGTVVVSYVYDAWGRPISKTGTLANTLGTVQPFRYRGYVYDEETGFYYLQSRYYSPVWCRFVNSDSLLVPNLFKYCGNTPVNAVDPSGHFYSTLYEYAEYHPEINVDEYGIGELRGNYVNLRSTPCEDSSVPIIETLDVSCIDAFYIKRGAYVVEGEPTSPYVENSTPGRVWVEVMIFYYRADQLAEYDYIPPKPLVGYISADHVWDLTNNVKTVRPGTTNLRLRCGPGKEHERKAYLNSSGSILSDVAVYYQEEVGGTTWSYINSYEGCGWVMSYFIGEWY